jgi:hypothetical protein
MQPALHRYITIICILFFFIPVKSQDYEKAIKINAFPGFGVSYKHLTGFENGYELKFHSFSNYNAITALRIFQTPAWPRVSDKWFLIYGYGSHLSLYNSYSIYNPFKPFDPPRKVNRNFLSAGFDGLAGFEYRFLKYPFNISFDINANFEFFGPDYFRVNIYNTVGFAYVF